jgi:hypothetical protein
LISQLEIYVIFALHHVLSFSPNCLDSAISMLIYGIMKGKTWMCGKGLEIVGIRLAIFGFMAR